MTWFNIPSTFINIRNYLNYFWNHFWIHGYITLFPQIYFNLPFYKMKWNNFSPFLLPRLYSNIICKNIVKIFQEFEVGYIQTCTFLKSSTMWQLKRVHCNLLSPLPSSFISWSVCVCWLIIEYLICWVYIYLGPS